MVLHESNNYTYFHTWRDLSFTSTSPKVLYTVIYIPTLLAHTNHIIRLNTTYHFPKSLISLGVAIIMNTSGYFCTSIRKQQQISPLAIFIILFSIVFSYHPLHYFFSLLILILSIHLLSLCYRDMSESSSSNFLKIFLCFRSYLAIRFWSLTLLFNRANTRMPSISILLL